MCKRKNNLEKIKKFQRSLNFRVDYYSIPGSIVPLVKSIYNGDVYVERKPTEEEMQIIDYDGVASCMNTTITELLYHPCHIIIKKDDERCTVYIHRNFMSIQYNTTSSDENDDIINKVAGFLLLVFKEGHFNVQDVCCQMIYSCPDTEKDDIWNKFDKTAFPVMEEANMINGTYVDTHQCGDFYIDLTRNISPNDSGKYDVVVKTSALFNEGLDDVKDEEGLRSCLSGIVTESVNEITRCFAE